MRQLAHITLPWLLFSLGAFGLGCASTPSLGDAEKLRLYNAHAGAPVRSFRYFGSINSWTALADDAIAVWTRPAEAWLLDLSGPCPNIEFAPSISLSSTMNTVSARFDKVTVHGAGSMQIPCHIAQIRPIDVKALRAAERELSQSAASSGT